MKVHIRRILIFMYFAVPLLLLGLVARFPAIPITSPSDYWAVACGSQPNEIPERHRYSSQVGLDPQVDGWLYYFVQEHHGEPIFRVDAASAAQLLPAVSEAPELNLCRGLEWREAQWCEDSLARSPLCSTAISDGPIGVREVVALHRQLVAGLSSEEPMQFFDRLNRARLRHAEIAFEAVFILSWHLFFAWP